MFQFLTGAKIQSAIMDLSRKDDKTCPYCGKAMLKRKQNLIVPFANMNYHIQPEIYVCETCQFEKLATCDVRFWCDDLPVIDETELMEETKETIESTTEEAITKTEEQEDNKQESDEQTDAAADQATQEASETDNTPDSNEPGSSEREESQVSGLFTAKPQEEGSLLADVGKMIDKVKIKLTSKKKLYENYVRDHKPKVRLIKNDILYDTGTSECFFASDKTFDDEIYRTYYYKTQSGFFFKVTVSYGQPDDFATMREEDIKKLLSKVPDIYMRVIGGNIITDNIASEQQEEKTAQQDTSAQATVGASETTENTQTAE